MNSYPSNVRSIVDDYLGRLRRQMVGLPPADQIEFLREIESHIYESYQAEATHADEDPVPRILAVLAKLGEPSELVSTRLADSLLRSQNRSHYPLRILTGILLAIFALPLGISGAAVFVGIYVSLAALLFSYFVVAASLALTGGLILAMGLTYIYLPGLFDKLVAAGVIELGYPLSEIMRPLDPGTQGFLFLLAAFFFLAVAAALFWSGRYAFRGFTGLSVFTFSRIREGLLRFRKHWDEPIGRRRQPGDHARFSTLHG